MTKLILNIDGMHCAACSATVERAVKKIEGVDEVSVNLTGGNALVVFDENKVNIETIMTAINNAGFTPSIPENVSKSVKKERSEKESAKAKKALIFSIVFSLPLFYISMGHMLGAPLPGILNPDFNPVPYALSQLILSLMVMISGYGIFKSALISAFHRNLNMDTLIFVGSSTSFVYSVYSFVMILNGNSEYIHQLYFESAGMIITFILIGRYLESASKRKTNSAVEKLMDLSPSTAHILIDGIEKEVSTDSLKINDIIVVKSGMTVPVDGVVLKGNCSADESMLTGESLPVEKVVASEVYGGTINLNGYVEVKVTADISESSPARIADYVNKAQATKAPIANFANKIASIFVPAVIIIAAVSALAWLVSGQPLAFAIKIFVCVLVIACPCSLGLATPTALTVSMGKSASKGILIKSGEALQRLNEVDTVVFDKTGTVTKGKTEVTDFKVFNGFEFKKTVSLFASAESKSSHPLAKAITDYSNDLNTSLNEVANCEFITGMGILCDCEGKKIICGNKKLMQKYNVDVAYCSDYILSATQKGKSVVMIAVDGVLAACAEISDPIKENCSETVSLIKKLDLKTVMLTGDNRLTADEIASKVGIDSVYSELLPEEKLEIINRLKTEGKKVVMVGDGINDAPSLTASDVGMAIGTGTDIAVESADIVLIGGDISSVLTAIKISKRTMKIVKQNLFWAFAYNVICIPVAAGLLFALGGPLLSPMVAAAAMSLSSVTVVTNSLRLYK